ncbi:Ff.00g032720.m01.CDS01 [Fusarium sp. VM40]|nr:Ff.00g032720.m01.CDS01 [Fusarium sp. VM40]
MNAPDITPEPASEEDKENSKPPVTYRLFDCHGCNRESEDGNAGRRWACPNGLILKGKEFELRSHDSKEESFDDIYRLDPTSKTPSGVDELAQVLQKEIPKLTFNYFGMHYTAWGFPSKVKEAFDKAHVAPMFKSVGSATICSWTLATVMRELLADGKGGLVKYASEWSVEPEGVEGIGIITGLRENTSRSRELDGLVGDGRGHVPDTMFGDLVSLLLQDME